MYTAVSPKGRRKESESVCECKNMYIRTIWNASFIFIEKMYSVLYSTPFVVIWAVCVYAKNESSSIKKMERKR